MERDETATPVTAAELFPLPPSPVQLSVNVLVLTAETATASLPDVAFFEPLQAPDAVQLVASVTDHVTVVVAPRGTIDGLAEIVTTGGFGVSS